MQSKWKRALGVALATACISTAFVGCGDGTFDYQGDVLDGYVSSGEVSSNGGFAVEKGDFVYFINGNEAYTADNTYGEVVKGALMRISKTDLANGDYSNVKTVVPSLFAAQDYDAGIYIYGDYVYYATPTTDNDKYGNVANSELDFKRAKIDGTEGPMSGNFFRVTNNATKYRYVQKSDGVVYCLYEDGTTLKSYNTATGDTTTLVSGANSSYYFDAANPENPNVYYTMSVKSDETGTQYGYNQVYCVSAFATASVDEEGSYSVYDETGAKIKEYSFDVEEMKAENAETEKYDFADYSTYPYVNLGELVLDGIGSNAELNPKTQYNWEETSENAAELEGYTYSLETACYTNGALYFTRSAVGTKTESDTTDTKLYCLTDETKNAANWNTVTGNGEVALVAHNTTNAKLGSALFYREGEKQYYLYKTTDGNSQKHLWRAGYDNETNTEIAPVRIKQNTGDVNLWKIDETTKTLYYYGTGEVGNNLVKIKYDGTSDDYDTLTNKGTAYEAVKLDVLGWSSDWYKPEIIGDIVLYPNAQTFGDTAYNYIYAATLGEISDVTAANETRADITAKLGEYDSYAELKNAMEYYYRTGETTLFEAVRDEYSSSEQEHFDAFVEMFEEGGEFAGEWETSYVHLVGKMSDADSESVKAGWESKLRVPEAEDEAEEQFPTWAIILIACSALLIICSATVLISIKVKAKKKAKAEAEATVNAAKRKKINTEDDKSINVYETEETEEPETESAETAETTETVEENVEESVEEPVEKADDNQEE